MVSSFSARAATRAWSMRCSRKQSFRSLCATSRSSNSFASVSVSRPAASASRRLTSRSYPAGVACVLTSLNVLFGRVTPGRNRPS